MPFRGKMDSEMLGRNSKALIHVAWVEKLNPLCLFAPPCQKTKVLVRWSQVQMKQTNTDFRGLITNRGVRTLLPILHDWLLSPGRQACPIEINRIFAVGFPGTKISFPIIHHLIWGMSFSNWFTANLQEKLPLLKNMLSFFSFLSHPPFFFSTFFTFSSSPFTKGINFPLVILSCFVLSGWDFFWFCFYILLHAITWEVVPPGMTVSDEDVVSWGSMLLCWISSRLRTSLKHCDMHWLGTANPHLVTGYITVAQHFSLFPRVWEGVMFPLPATGC